MQSHGQSLKQEGGFSAVLCNDTGVSPGFLHQFNGCQQADETSKLVIIVNFNFGIIFIFRFILAFIL